MENENFLEKLQKNQLLDLYLVSLISADSLIDVESCEQSYEEVLKLKELMKNANIIFLYVYKFFLMLFLISRVFGGF